MGTLIIFLSYHLPWLDNFLAFIPLTKLTSIIQDNLVINIHIKFSIFQLLWF